MRSWEQIVNSINAGRQAQQQSVAPVKKSAGVSSNIKLNNIQPAGGLPFSGMQPSPSASLNPGSNKGIDVGKIAAPVVNAVKQGADFVSKQNISSPFNPRLPFTYGQAGDVVKSVVQAPFRDIKSAELSLTGKKDFNPVQKETNPITGKEFTTRNDSLLFGKEPIKNLQGRVNETNQFAQKLGVNKNLAGIGAIPLTAALMAVDFTPLGGSRKAATKEALALATKAKTAEEFLNLFNKAKPEIKKVIETGIKDKKLPYNSVEEFFNFAKSGGKSVAQPTTQTIGTTVSDTKLLGSGDPLTRVRETLAKNKGIVSEQSAIYKKEVAARVQAADQAYERAGGGLEGLRAKRAAMSGQYTKAKNTNGELAKQISEGDIKFLLDQVHGSNALGSLDKLNVQDALEKLIYENKPLQAAQIEKLSKVFSPDLVNSFKETSAKIGGNKLLELGTLPRALKSTLDYSAPLRQGLFFATSHPKDFLRSFKNMFGYSFSEKKLLNFGEDLIKRPTYVNGAMEKAGISYTNLGGGLLNKEEAFMSNLAEHLPTPVGRFVSKFVRASDRAYTGFLNNFRADLFDTMYKGLTDAEKADSKILKDIGGLINAGTGRGNYKDALSLPGKIGVGKFSVDLKPVGESVGGTLSTSAPLLNNIFFSPRLIASRITLLNPFYYKQLSGPARKEALKGLVTTVAAGLTALGLAKINGADVVTDSTNADFGKIKFGDGTRYDPWGGYQQYVTFIARMILQKSTSSSSGKVTTFGTGFSPSNTLSISKRFVRSKLAPVPALAVDLMAGTDFIGNKVTPGSITRNLIEPFILNDLEDTIKTYGLFGPIVSMPGLFGVGSQTYNDKTATPKSSTRTPIGTRVL